MNGWARIVAVTAGKLTLDNLPTGWAANAGAGKTLRVFFGDRIKNGVTMFSNTIERGWLRAGAALLHHSNAAWLDGAGRVQFRK
ncbi:hypothetical protein F2981_02515 [Sinorhizobium meliloti]|nr:hypothetical protein [Sinorhizobium meliloti]